MGPRKGSVDPHIKLTKPTLFNLKLTKKQIPNQSLNEMYYPGTASAELVNLTMTFF